MSSLQDTLARLLTIPGIQAAALVARDGLPIASAGRGDEHFHETLGALAASALGTAEALGHDLAQGHTIGTLLEYENALVSVDPMGEYALVVTLAENAASLGRLRATLRTSRDEILRLLDMP